MALIDLLKSGNALLLGEGDFSFTRSLTSSMTDASRLVSTSFLSEDAIVVHKSASENIHHARKAGAVIRFNIDATTIHQMETLNSQVWDCIVFNFPHVGGKSNIKKNRKLLKEFFSSAVHIISPGGKIAVTLCQGQGGTSRDRPMRAWHDSWQVVAMAAFAGLILNEVVPFCAQDYPFYSCTGFRSQDKGFHTENALTHIFVRSTPISPEPCSTNLNQRTVQIDDRHFQCPSYLARRLHKQLHTMVNHPIGMVSHRIQERVKSKWDSVILDPTSFPAYRTTENLSCGNNEVASSVFSAQGHQNESFFVLKQLPPGDDGDFDGQQSNVQCDSTSQSYMLRNSLLHHANHVISVMADHQVAVLTGQVYLRCAIDERNLPVHHEMLLVGVDDKMNGVSENFSSNLEYIISSAFEPRSFEITFKECDETNSTRQFQVQELLFNQSFDIFASGSSKLSNQRILVGKVFLVEHQTDSNLSWAALLNLDAITHVTYSIQDPRQLWTDDERFFQQFNVQEGKHDFTPYSLHSRSYVHDISFWTSIDFTEMKLCDIIRDIADDYVTSLELIDQYHDDTGRTSLCYRMVFGACDQALSYDDSYNFYQIIRSSLPEKLKIVLR